MPQYNRTPTNIEPYTQRFELNEGIKKELKTKTPNFGFNGLGEVVFRRTYSRDNEDWCDVVIRVVQGAISIRKEHFIRNSLRWNDDDWQEFASDMALSLFEMEWLPPGRGLWMMGTDFVYERGSMALNNCSATDTKDDLVHSAEWTMDGLMNGVGVGFSTSWRGTATAPDKSNPETFVVPDSREGWVQSLIHLMCAYIDSPRYGKTTYPKFDYSQIREKGLPIRGFGGQSSGPDPLKKMHIRIEGYLDAFCAGELVVPAKEATEWSPATDEVRKPYSHTRLITDIFNAIGACVVAGNVRRSAEICLGDVHDDDFINLKNYDMNPERMEIGWMSNNSVALKPDDGFEDFSYIPDMAKRNIDNGEPGLINLYNMQKYGRYGKEMPDEASLCNPCFHADTLIATADGRNAVSIKQLAEEGKDVPVYSMDTVTGEMSVQWGRNPRVTGHNKKLLRVHFEGSNKGEYLDVTPNHRFILNDGREVEAKDLSPGDSLPQFKKSKFNDDYIRVYTPTTGKYQVEHRMIAEFHDPTGFAKNYKEDVSNGFCHTRGVVVHHKDEDKTNNHPDNLEITTASEHNRIHNVEYVGEGNPMYGKTQTDATRDLIRNKAIERNKDPEYKRKVSEAVNTPENREAGSKRMKLMREKELIAYYDEIEKQNHNGLDLIRLSPTCLQVARTCENDKCACAFTSPWAKREIAFCSKACANTKKASIASRRAGQKKTCEGKAKEMFHKQVMLYKDLIEANQTIDKKTFESACKKAGVSCRFNAKSDNQWIAKGWNDFKERADGYNHRVSWVEELEGDHTVYNITVDNNHTLAVVTKGGSSMAQTGVITFQCGEICLENFELCNLSETFPHRCANLETFNKALKFATFYSTSVSLLPTHRPETNAVIAKNRRIGVSISGIAQWVSGAAPEGWGLMNYTRLTRILREGYKIVKDENTLLAKRAGVPPSIRVTTIKPSGSISLLAGATAGVHYPVSRYAIRRMRIGVDSPLVPALKEANIPHEPDSYSDNTLVFEFAIDHGEVRPCEEVSPWEQFSLVAMLQRCWADNMVSATVYFDKEKDAKDVEKLLAMFIPVLKSVSMLPHSGHGYAQAPYEPIDQVEYEKRRAGYHKPKFASVKGSVPTGSKFCDGDSCEL
jgi:intein/homing endonuclease